MSPGAGALAAVLTLVAAGALRAAARDRRRATASGRLRSGAPGSGAPPAVGTGPAPTSPREPGRPRRRLGPGPPAGAGRLGRRMAEAGLGTGGGGTAWLGRRMAEAGLGGDPAVALRAWCGGGAIAVATALAAAGPGAALVAGALATAGPCLGWRLARHRGEDRLEAALPAAVEAVAAGLRSGASLRQAVAGAARATPGPLGNDLAVVAAATERGAGVVVPLEQWAERRPLPGVRLVVAALCLGAETGGATAQAVDGVALTLRQRLAAEAEARALATQARVSAVVIGASPVVFCALAAATDPRTAGFLLRTPLGLTLLATGLALDGAGALWMARLTRVVP